MGGQNFRSTIAQSIENSLIDTEKLMCWEGMSSVERVRKGMKIRKMRGNGHKNFRHYATERCSMTE
jgi:hypothetical protein